MRFALFYHSLVSDWNHGNAHFLRGVATQLLARGHEVRVYEPEGGWSLRNLLQEQGEAALSEFRSAARAYGVRYPRESSYGFESSGNRFWRLARQLQGTGYFRALSRDRAYSSPALHPLASRHPYDSGVRSARLRHSPGVRSLG